MLKILNKLNQSKFRSSFKLKQKDIDYINTKGLDTIKAHAQDFISKRLADPLEFIDGKQTPTKGHPVFIAQHATATCCRECLYKWHHFPQSGILNNTQQEYVVNIIMQWIEEQLQK